MAAEHAPRRCLVGGGSGALGGAVVGQLVTAGARVVFTYRTNEARARALEEQHPGACAVRCELAAVGDVERAAAAAVDALQGGLDVLVQCAGVGVTVPGAAGARAHQALPAIDEAAWDTMLDVNVKGTFFLCRALRPQLVAARGDVVLVGSIDGVKPVPAPVHYAASKGALAGMTQALAKELGPHGVRVNLVAPGLMDGGLSRDVPEALRQEYLKHCGLRRLGGLAEVARVIVWFALRNSYVTGRTILVDGGL